MDKIIDNIAKVDNGELRGETDCFEIEDAFEIGISYINNYINTWTLFKDSLLFSFENPACLEIENILNNARDIKTNNEVIFSNLRNMLKCIIISNLDLDLILYEALESLGIQNFNDLLNEYQQQYTDLMDGVEDLTSFEELENLEESLAQSLESLQDSFNSIFKSIMTVLSEHILSIFNVTDAETRGRVYDEIEYIDIREIETKEDLLELVYNILKIVLKIENPEEKREPVLTEDYLNNKTFEFVANKFLSIYFDEMLNILNGNTLGDLMDIETTQNNLAILNKFERYMEFFSQDFENLLFKFIEQIFIEIFYDKTVKDVRGLFICEEQLNDSETEFGGDSYSYYDYTYFSPLYKSIVSRNITAYTDCEEYLVSETITYTDFTDYVSSDTNDGLENFKQRAVDYILLYVQNETACINNIENVIKDYVDSVVVGVQKQRVYRKQSGDYWCAGVSESVSDYKYRPIIKINGLLIEDWEDTPTDLIELRKKNSYFVNDYDTKPIIIDKSLNPESITPLRMFRHIKNNITLDFIFDNDLQLEKEFSIVEVFDDFIESLSDSLAKIYKTIISWIGD